MISYSFFIVFRVNSIVSGSSNIYFIISKLQGTTLCKSKTNNTGIATSTMAARMGSSQT
jgi:hypothetical protein